MPFGLYRSAGGSVQMHLGVRDIADETHGLSGPVRDPINGPCHPCFASAIPRTA